MKKLVLTLVLTLFPTVASAALPTYTGSFVVPSSANITYTGGGNGCLISTGGVLSIAACPAGTAAFSGSVPIVITGTGPYTITCPTCFVTGGGTVSGASTFSSTLGVNGLLTASAGITSSSTSAPVTSGVAGAASSGFQIGASLGFTQIHVTASTGCQSVTGSGLNIKSNGTTIATMDTSGNLGLCGVLYTASKRAYKQDIHPLSVDALQVLHDTNFVSFRYKAQYANPTQTHLGFIADDTPSILSGPKHDHFEVAALAVVEGKAIQELGQQVQSLTVMVGVLLTLCVVLIIGVIGVARRS